MNQTSWTKYRIMIGSINVIIGFAFNLKISNCAFFDAKNGPFIYDIHFLRKKRSKKLRLTGRMLSITGNANKKKLKEE